MDRLPTTNELANALAAFQSRIESFSAEYEFQMSWDDAVAEAGLLRRSIVRGSYFFALKGEKRCRRSETVGISDLGKESRTIRDEAYDGFETRTRIGNRKIQIRQGKPSSSGNAISSSIGWPTTDWDREQIANDPKRAVFFPSILRAGNWTISEDQLEDPVVLAMNEQSEVRAWFDMTLGPCLVRLEIKNPWPGIAKQTRVLKDFEQFGNQIFLPRIMTQESVIVESQTKELIGMRTSTVNVSKYSVNNIDDALFSVPIQEGDRVFA